MRTFLLIALFSAALTVPAVVAQTSNEDCLTCHDQVDAKQFNASVHAPLQCTNCHASVTGPGPHEPAAKPVDCSSCHADSVAAWNESLHAKAVKSGSARGARCVDCHGSPHAILPASDPKSPVARATIPTTCSRCHGQTFVMDKAGLSTQPAVSYQNSVHGHAVAAGSSKAAVCTDCHDHHAVRPANDPLSGIFKFNVARTCGKCHAAIAGQYVTSVHGTAMARGNWNAPVCSDCHGIHTIAKASDRARGPRASCVHCHDGVRLNQEFGVPAARVQSYESSYHGLARRMGSTVAADCASCHGAHDVLPSSNPRSNVNVKNLPRTCGKCHDGVAANFANGKIHMVVSSDASDRPTQAIHWIRLIYIVLIVLTIGFMALHNIMLWVRKARRHRHAAGRNIMRMNLNQRVQHLILVASFVVLVISGFALAWPTSFFSWFFGPSEEFRRLVHRIAAVIMIVLGLYHLGYMIFTSEGRKGLRDLWFRFSDARDLAAVMRDRPSHAGRFTYAEKAEYWAGLWGTMVMAVTGAVIWYAVGVARWIPRWWVDIATAIHFYEAILATLAIVVWHFYHVIFDPDIYPMNFAWFDGKMSEHLYHEEHPADFDAAPRTEENPDE